MIETDGKDMTRTPLTFRASPVPSVAVMHTALQQHQERFCVLENKLDAAFTNLLARLNLISPGSCAPPTLERAASAAAAPMLPPSSCKPKIASPRAFEGDFELCRSFLVQCNMVFRHQPFRFTSDGAKIAFIFSLLTGRALQWATAAVDHNHGLSTNFATFLSEFQAVFDHPANGGDVASRLHSLQQGSHSVAGYTLEFRTLAADSGWDNKALLSPNVSRTDCCHTDRPPTMTSSSRTWSWTRCSRNGQRNKDSQPVRGPDSRRGRIGQLSTPLLPPEIGLKAPTWWTSLGFPPHLPEGWNPCSWAGHDLPRRNGRGGYGSASASTVVVRVT
ncbi:uncharacterized protein [Nerophis lumbriciformis]|uniref:uncharacterized protein n=1 Tax=Nerophis lumbriciformis TaxID=546530 RepID=UPI002AE06F0B|nr:uncharacterized protein LOC133610093 [Nerophis lumbriciformis]